MNFFLETGMYVLIVALAAAVTGFVAFKVAMSLKGVFKMRRPGRRAAGSAKQTDAGGVGERGGPDTIDRESIRSMPSGAASPELQQAAAAMPEEESVGVAQMEEPQAMAPSEAPMPTHTPEGVVRDGDLGEHDSRVKGREEAPQDGEMVEEPPVQPAATDGTQITDEAPEQPEADSADDESLKTVMALPEERDGESAFMAMFGNDNNDESSVGDLAAAVEDTDLSALLEDARSLVAVLRREGDSDA